MKIGVYAIAKNEAAHVDEWLQAVSEADAVCVTDTGSVDDTADRLRDGGAAVTEYREPFRFDMARNFALQQAQEKAPDVDIWVSLDLDEMPEKGWRAKLEAAAAEGVRGWRITIDNGGYTFQNIRAHRSGGWIWKHACHEILNGFGPVADSRFKVVHKQDRSKPRYYLPLLELDAAENSRDGRAWHYLGREYMYLQRWQDAVVALEKSLLYDQWQEQAGRAMVFLSRCCWRLNQQEAALAYAHGAVRAFCSREAWLNLAWLLDWQKDPAACLAAEKALEITAHGVYPDEGEAWSPATEKWLKEVAAK